MKALSNETAHIIANAIAFTIVNNCENPEMYTDNSERLKQEVHNLFYKFCAIEHFSTKYVDINDDDEDNAY